MKRKLTFRLVLLAVSIISTVTTFTDRLTSVNGDGSPVALFFTAWSVWYVLALSVYHIIFTASGKRESNLYLMLWFCITITIVTTFGVSLGTYIIRPGSINYWSFGSIFKHILLPLLAVIDMHLYYPRNSIKLSYPFASTVPAILYWTGIITRALLKKKEMGGSIPEEIWSSYYPYEFVNLEHVPLSRILLLLCFIAVFVITFGLIIRIINKKKPSK